jgi:hypothetical protein
MKIYVTLENIAGELDSIALDLDPDDDPAEVSNAIQEAIETWVLAPGDIIRIVERA